MAPNISSPHEDLSVEQAVETIGLIRVQVENIDAALAEINERFMAEFTPLTERRARLMAAWQSLYDLLPDLPQSAASAPTETQSEPPQDQTAFPRRFDRLTPRRVMLELLRTTSGPVTAEALWAAVQAAGLKTKMIGSELVYQTLYHARKVGVPIARNEDGSWHWVRDSAAA